MPTGTAGLGVTPLADMLAVTVERSFRMNDVDRLANTVCSILVGESLRAPDIPVSSHYWQRVVFIRALRHFSENGNEELTAEDVGKFFANAPGGSIRDKIGYATHPPSYEKLRLRCKNIDTNIPLLASVVRQAIIYYRNVRQHGCLEAAFVYHCDRGRSNSTLSKAYYQ